MGHTNRLYQSSYYRILPIPTYKNPFSRGGKGMHMSPKRPNGPPYKPMPLAQGHGDRTLQPGTILFEPPLPNPIPPYTPQHFTMTMKSSSPIVAALLSSVLVGGASVPTADSLGLVKGQVQVRAWSCRSGRTSSPRLAWSHAISSLWVETLVFIRRPTRCSCRWRAARRGRGAWCGSRRRGPRPFFYRRRRGPASRVASRGGGGRLVADEACGADHVDVGRGLSFIGGGEVPHLAEVRGRGLGQDRCGSSRGGTRHHLEWPFVDFDMHKARAD